MVLGKAWFSVWRGLAWRGSRIKFERRISMGVVSVTVKQAAENISNMARGTVLSHIALTEMLEANKRQYSSRVNSLNKALKSEYGIFLQNERGVGYRISLPGDEINVCEGRCNRGKRQFLNGVKDMNKIDISKIADKSKLDRTIKITQEQANLVIMLKFGVTAQIST
jgi:hypothetical protein